MQCKGQLGSGEDIIGVEDRVAIFPQGPDDKGDDSPILVGNDDVSGGGPRGLRLHCGPWTRGTSGSGRQRRDYYLEPNPFSVTCAKLGAEGRSVDLG